MTPQARKLGRVALVGAGPGDPQLITVRGLQYLQAADVVVYDALANPDLLAHAPDDAERIDVGKRAGEHRLPQDRINQLLLDHARAGHFVVRLKGGDPYLFGRGAEEAAWLGRHGIECEVVPGITAAIAAPAMAGIPVTHRDHASAVVFVTGHENPDKPEAAIDYAALAALVRAGGTACFYMGVGRLASICDRLAECGLDSSTPVAVVQWGTLPQQRSVRATLDTVLAHVERERIGSPAIIVVGAVAGLDEPGLDYFTARPLFGQTILITRTRQQNAKIRTRLEALGGQVMEAPTIQRTMPTEQVGRQVDEALRQLAQFDWLILTSAGGANAVADRLFALGLDSRSFASVKVGVVGHATAAALRDRLGVVADLVPTRFTADALADELLADHEVAGRRMLLLRANLARPALPEALEAAGAHVTNLPIYETRPADQLPAQALTALRERRVDWATFTSASTATNLVRLLGDEAHLLNHVRLASIGPVTSQTMRELGLTVAAEADEATLDDLVAVMARQRGEAI